MKKPPLGVAFLRLGLIGDYRKRMLLIDSNTHRGDSNDSFGGVKAGIEIRGMAVVPSQCCTAMALLVSACDGLQAVFLPPAMTLEGIKGCLLSLCANLFLCFPFPVEYPACLVADLTERGVRQGLDIGW